MFSDVAIRTWFASHEILSYIVVLFVAGSLAGLIRKRPDDEWLAWKAKNPGLAMVVETLRGYGIDGPKIAGAVITYVITKLAGELDRDEPPKPPPSAPPPGGST